MSVNEAVLQYNFILKSRKHTSSQIGPEGWSVLDPCSRLQVMEKMSVGKVILKSAACVNFRGGTQTGAGGNPGIQGGEKRRYHGAEKKKKRKEKILFQGWETSICSHKEITPWSPFVSSRRSSFFHMILICEGK